MVRTGDIDNMGFGWPTNFNPFSGQNTPAHSYPWTPDLSNPAGTDRIMVVTSYVGTPPAGRDGYTSGTSRPGNAVSPVTLHYSFSGTITHAYIYAFLDDFQAPVWGASYQVTLDGIRIPLYESVVNSLVQTGPIGKIVKLPVPNNLLYLLQDGMLEIKFDDPTTGAGDGFAIDFIKLVINPVNTEGSCVLKGTVTDFATGLPISNVRVSANGLDSTFTDAAGMYRMAGVDPGILFIQTYKAGFSAEVASLTLPANDSATRNFQLRSGAPQLIFNSPANGAVSVPSTAKIKLRFSQTMNNATFNAGSFVVSDGQTNVNGTYQSDGDTLIFVPDSLQIGKMYTAIATIKLKGSNGLALDRDYSFSFYTYNPVATENLEFRPLPTLYPNPSSEQLFLKGLRTDESISIRNAIGQSVHQSKANGPTHTINVEALPSGLYILQIGEGLEMRLMKFIRQ